VLVEGFKLDTHAKIEVHRAATGASLIAQDDVTILAMASDVVHSDLNIPSISLNDTVAIADFLLEAVGLAEALSPASRDAVPLRNDCFALPAGVDWLPVDTALTLLKERITPCVGRETLPISEIQAHILASDMLAVRSNPPGANSAVDGYGFAWGSTGPGVQSLQLLDGRAAAGAPFDGTVPHGKAVRIFTGALLPTGVDTVVLQEDVTLDGDHISFVGPVKQGANARAAGEDIHAGTRVLAAGHLLRAPDLALLSATGISSASVFDRLRVGILSTGDEIVPAGGDSHVSKTYDANRPMLLGLIDEWGYQPVDLGHVGDDRADLRARLDAGAKITDVMLTSGGASAGDEDHMSALLEEAGALFSWRIALKPGRPLALALWNKTPIFGLPGNPVAALICTLIFARPALSVLAGGQWTSPQGFDVPADFEKNKKPGRREYLRARINDAGRVEVFASEGSGRISGISWADGLVELADEAMHIQPGDRVRYIPYSSFGL
ncbi:MAG: molybdopterin-binding protein, partial [Paracoccaceae bacterium]